MTNDQDLKVVHWKKLYTLSSIRQAQDRFRPVGDIVPAKSREVGELAEIPQIIE